MDRRSFIKVGAYAIGGLGASTSMLLPSIGTGATANNSVKMNFFIGIHKDDCVLLQLTKPEIGQGIETGIAMVVCDEIGASWNKLEVTLASYQESPEVVALSEEPQFFTTGASNGIRRTWLPLRQLAATVRDLLERSAAARWNVSSIECTTRDSKVIHTPSGRALSFGELAEEAANLPPIGQPRLKSRSEYHLVGSPIKSRRTEEIVRGRCEYSIDLELDNMVHASVIRSPTTGGGIQSVDRSRALAIDGVIDVVSFDGFPESGNHADILDSNFAHLIKAGVAVLAKNPWAALKARRELSVTWKECETCDKTTNDLRNELTRVLDEPGDVVADVGEVDSAFSTSSVVVETVYENPYQASFGLEPLNATARMTNDGGIEIWAGSQSPQMTSRFIAELLGIPVTKVIFHNIISGGSFGRRYYCDFVGEAAKLAQISGHTIKLMWTREDDIRHSKYHAFRLERHRIGLDESNRPYCWDYSVGLGPNDYIGFHGPYVPYFMGLTNRKAQSHNSDMHLLHRGSWRSVMLHPQNLSLECTVDEIATKIDEDPLELRLRWLSLPPHSPGESISDEEVLERINVQERAKTVLRTAATGIGWNDDLPEELGVGIALGRYVDTFVAQAAIVSIAGGKLHIVKIVCAFDCGLVINPNLVRSQVEGSIVWALGPILFDPIEVKDGAVVQSNFHDYQVPRMANTPDIDVILVDSDGPPAGVGEPAVLGVAPAVLNAISQVSGKRIRKLPVRTADLSGAG